MSNLELNYFMAKRTDPSFLVAVDFEWYHWGLYGSRWVLQPTSAGEQVPCAGLIVAVLNAFIVLHK